MPRRAGRRVSTANGGSSSSVPVQRPPPSQEARAPPPRGSSGNFVRVDQPGNRYDGRRGIQMLPHELSTLPWAVPTPGRGQVVVMLESLETIVIPERCAVPVSSLQDVRADREEVRQFNGYSTDGSRRDRSYTTHHGGGLTAVARGNEHLAHAKDASRALEALKFTPKILHRRGSLSSGGGGSSRRGSLSLRS